MAGLLKSIGRTGASRLQQQQLQQRALSASGGPRGAAAPCRAWWQTICSSNSSSSNNRSNRNSSSKWLLLQQRGSQVLTRDSVALAPSSSRRVSLLLSRLPPHLCSAAAIATAVSRAGVSLPLSFILIQKSRLGRPTGRCLLLTDPPPAALAAAGEAAAAAAEAAEAAAAKEFVSNLLAALPAGIQAEECDAHGTKRALDEFEGFYGQTEALQRLGRQGSESLERVITLQPVPKHWRAQDVQDFLKKTFSVSVGIEDIVFTYNCYGEQQPVCFCCCGSEREAVLLLQHLQEVAVPNHPVYPDLFGCSFLYASRAALFVSHENLDYLPVLRKFQVFTYGWEKDLKETELVSLLHQLRVFPSGIVRLPMASWEASGFLLQFDRMRDVKLVMVS